MWGTDQGRKETICGSFIKDGLTFNLLLSFFSLFLEKSKKNQELASLEMLFGQFLFLFILLFLTLGLGWGFSF